MKVYALTGKSGTGKSYKAQYVAGIYNIEYILDDGLLIKGNAILAGKSAKREETKFAAVKRAIFIELKHREEVKRAIAESNIEKLLIVGTSPHMVNTIMRTLEIHEEPEIIRIEDISTRDEMKEAEISRRVNGKHVIPVPTFEIKKDFSGYFMDSVKNLVRNNDKTNEYHEKSVVRPTFSYLGSYEIKDSVLKAIAEQSVIRLKEVYKVHDVEVKNQKEGISVNVNMTAKLLRPIPDIAKDAVKCVKEDFEYMTGINVLEVNIEVRTVVL